MLCFSVKASRLRISRQGLFKPFERAAISRLVARDHPRPDEGNDLNGELYRATILGWLKLQRIECDGQAGAAFRKCLARNHALIWNDDMVRGPPLKSQVVPRPASEDIASPLAKIGLIVSQAAVSRRTPLGARQR